MLNGNDAKCLWRKRIFIDAVSFVENTVQWVAFVYFMWLILWLWFISSWQFSFFLSFPFPSFPFIHIYANESHLYYIPLPRCYFCNLLHLAWYSWCCKMAALSVLHSLFSFFSFSFSFSSSILNEFSRHLLPLHIV